MMSFTVLTIGTGVLAVLVPIMNFIENGTMAFESIIVVIGLLLFSALFALMTKHLFQLRKIENLIVYENGVLNDHSKVFNRAVDLKIEDIESIGLWSENRGVIQFKIVTKRHDHKRNSLYNQLKGNDIYLSDYLVDSNALNELAKLIHRECA
ncbi:MAG: hypothetical protein E6Q38_01790 [Crocinitomicaceae bacterium]|nr:MAG: hypothetical protein E6Q38_01790 [Crocinitomicaceae bacterium]